MADSGMNRRDILDAALALITGDRDRDYGAARDNFDAIAAAWTLQLGPKLARGLTAEDVAMCMAQLKLMRLRTTPNHPDSWIDLAGYAALGGEVSETRLMQQEPKK